MMRNNELLFLYASIYVVENDVNLCRKEMQFYKVTQFNSHFIRLLRKPYQIA